MLSGQGHPITLSGPDRRPVTEQRVEVAIRVTRPRPLLAVSERDTTRHHIWDAGAARPAAVLGRSPPRGRWRQSPMKRLPRPVGRYRPLAQRHTNGSEWGLVWREVVRARQLLRRWALERVEADFDAVGVVDPGDNPAGVGFGDGLVIHALLVEPLYPRLEVGPGADSECDRIETG